MPKKKTLKPFFQQDPTTSINPSPSLTLQQAYSPVYNIKRKETNIKRYFFLL